jgi:hypothetical protein
LPEISYKLAFSCSDRNQKMMNISGGECSSMKIKSGCDCHIELADPSVTHIVVGGLNQFLVGDCWPRKLFHYYLSPERPPVMKKHYRTATTLITPFSFVLTYLELTSKTQRRLNTNLFICNLLRAFRSKQNSPAFKEQTI